MVLLVSTLRTERRHRRAHGEDAGSVAYLEDTRATEDEGRRRMGRLECERIHEEDH